MSQEKTSQHTELSLRQLELPQRFYTITMAFMINCVLQIKVPSILCEPPHG